MATISRASNGWINFTGVQTTAQTINFGSALTNGNLLVAYVLVTGNNANTVTVKDSNNVTFTVAGTRVYQSNSDCDMYMYYLPVSGSPGTGITFTPSAAVNFNAAVGEYTPSAPATFSVDTTGSGVGTSLTPSTSSNLSTTANDTAIIACCQSRFDGTPPHTGSGYTAALTKYAGFDQNVIEDKFPSSSGSYAADFTQGGGDVAHYYGVIATAFKATDSGGGGSTVLLDNSEWFTLEAQTNPLTVSRW